MADTLKALNGALLDRLRQANARIAELEACAAASVASAAADADASFSSPLSPAPSAPAADDDDDNSNNNNLDDANLSGKAPGAGLPAARILVTSAEPIAERSETRSAGDGSDGHPLPQAPLQKRTAGLARSPAPPPMSDTTELSASQDNTKAHTQSTPPSAAAAAAAAAAPHASPVSYTSIVSSTAMSASVASSSSSSSSTSTTTRTTTRNGRAMSTTAGATSSGKSLMESFLIACRRFIVRLCWALRVLWFGPEALSETAPLVRPASYSSAV